MRDCRRGLHHCRLDRSDRPSGRVKDIEETEHWQTQLIITLFYYFSFNLFILVYLIVYCGMDKE